MESAIACYLSEVGKTSPQAIVIAVAGPVADGCCRLMNNSWEVVQGEISSRFGAPVTLINDFVAIAHGLPVLSSQHCVPLGSVGAKPLDRDSVTVGVLGPGTGLGVAGLIKRGQFCVPLVSEAGHMGFAPEDALQREVLSVLARRYSRVSCERVVSGVGLENLYSALLEIDGKKPGRLPAAEIFELRRENGRSTARRAPDLFFQVLGQVTGDIALAFGAEDGIYIAGGIARRYPNMIAASKFRESFVCKGRHRGMLESVPTLLIDHPEPGLVGARINGLGEETNVLSVICC